MSLVEDEQEEKKADSGRVVVPPFLQGETPKAARPQWMQKLASNRALNAAKSVQTPVEESTSTEDKESDLPKEMEPTGPKIDSSAAPPPPSNLNESTHSVKQYIKKLQDNTPPPSTRKDVRRDGPEYLVTGTVPKARQLDEATRTADPWIKKDSQSSHNNSARKLNILSGSLHQKPMAPSDTHHLNSRSTHGNTVGQPTPVTPPTDQPDNEHSARERITEILLDSEGNSSGDVFEDAEVEEELVITDDEDEEGWEEESTSQDEEIEELNRSDEGNGSDPIDASSIIPGPPSPPQPEVELGKQAQSRIEGTTEKSEEVVPKFQLDRSSEIQSSTPVNRLEQPVPPSNDENEEPESWMYPHLNEDDSSWANPSRPIERERKLHLSEELQRKVDEVVLTNSDSTQRRAHLRAIDEDKRYSDQPIAGYEDNKLGLIVEQARDGQTISETSFSEISSKVEKSRVMETSLPHRDQDYWGMPSQDSLTSRAVGQMNGMNDGKDYRFSYIAAQHTHQTASYADVVRERYFPNENNEFWAAPVRAKPPEVALHITRNGEVQSGPPDGNESWMPPGNDSTKPPSKHATYKRVGSEDRRVDPPTVATDDSDWIVPDQERKGRSARVDFTGEVVKENSDSEDSFEWNPELQPPPPPDDPVPTPQTLDKELPGPPSDNEEEDEVRETDPEETGASEAYETSEVYEASEAFEASEEYEASETPGDSAAVDFGCEGEGGEPDNESVTMMRKAQANRNRSTPISNSSTEQAPAENQTVQRKYDYSPSGRLKFDMTPKMILIDDDVERGGGGGIRRRGTSRKEPKSRRLSVSVCVLLLLVPAAVVCVYFFVLRDDDDGPSPSLTFAPSLKPVAAPTTPPISATTAPVPAAVTSLPTRAPLQTAAPWVKGDELLDLLVGVSSDGGIALQDSSSPQYSAMEWIRTSGAFDNFDEQVLLQRYALATLYFSTGGEQWGTSTGWLTDAAECDWYTSSTISRICDFNGNIVELNLSGNNLVGSIPPELNLLSGSLGK